MYSPKIKDKHIPYLYRLARHLQMPMTRLVNEILEPVIERFKTTGIFEDLEKEEQALNELTAYFTWLLESRRTDSAEIIKLLRKVA